MILPFSPSSERNKRPIGRVLASVLLQGARVLEIGSGTAQHAEYLLGLRPDLRWLATEQPERLPGIRARLGELSRGVEVRALVVGRDSWPVGPVDAVFTANTLHIMPWSCSGVLLEQASRCLRPGGQLICYGPFSEDGRHNSDGNREFDRSLRKQDPHMGIRDLRDLCRLSEARGMLLVARFSMPANNRLLVFERD